MDGILIIDKPAGMTSHDVVARARRILRTKKIGHTGTLDPFATGVIVILVGKATRLAQFLDKDQKEYLALARFGFETETGDLTGEMRIANDERRIVSAAEIERILPQFRGAIRQTPPMYSAKKIAGKKLYELARRGIEIERKPVGVTIYELELVRKSDENDGRNGQPSTDDGQLETVRRPPFADYCLRVVCSAGTYIRTLAEDIGRALETGAHLAALRRTRAGKFALSQAVTLESLEEIAAANQLGEILISMNQAVGHLPEIKLNDAEFTRIKNGMKIRARAQFENGRTIRLTNAPEELVAVGVYDETEESVQPRLVLLN